jgi:hypothetical protein
MRLREVCDFLLPSLAVEGAVTVRWCLEQMAKQHGMDDYYEASSRWGAAFDTVIHKLVTHDEGPVIRPVNLTETQQRILDDRELHGSSGETADADIFDSIEWEFSEGWCERDPEIERWGSFGMSSGDNGL